MSIQRQGNWLGSQRVDVPHLRLVEASITGDFQVLSGTILAGNRALVVWGAVIADVGQVGNPASALVLNMAGSSFLHAKATEPGTIFTVDPAADLDLLNGTNPNVTGNFTPGVTNFVSIDLIRFTDPTTQDAVVFRSASTGQEFTQVVPLGRVLKYQISISTADFSTVPTACPIAKVDVDVLGNVVSITDCRQMYWRLGTGGSTPNPLATYAWANRDELLSPSAFTGGDKDIASQYEFNRATTQRLWELGGGEHWYSPADDRTVRLAYDSDVSVVFPLSGTNWYWDGTDLLWNGLRFIFANSTATYNVITSKTSAVPPGGDPLSTLLDGDVIFVEVNRAVEGATITPVKLPASSLFALPPVIPGSRYILAWRKDDGPHVCVYVMGQNGATVNQVTGYATNTALGTVRTFTIHPTVPTSPVVPVVDNDSAVILANPGAHANVIARGLTRDTPGTLVVGGGTNDSNFQLGQSAHLAEFLGLVQIDEGATVQTDIVNGIGLTSTGNGTGSGLRGTGGSTSAYGVEGYGGAPNGYGVFGQGTGNGAGIYGQGGNNGFGGYFLSNGVRGAIYLVPINGAPSSADEGSLYYDSVSKELRLAYPIGWWGIRPSGWAKVSSAGGIVDSGGVPFAVSFDTDHYVLNLTGVANYAVIGSVILHATTAGSDKRILQLFPSDANHVFIYIDDADAGYVQDAFNIMVWL